MFDIQDLDIKEVQRNLAIIRQLVHEELPDVDVFTGPFHDLVLYYSAIFATDNQHEIAVALDTLNIKTMLDNPDSFTKEEVDKLLSNWFITRKQGTLAKGEVKFTLDARVPFVIPKESIFNVDNISFKTENTHVIRIDTQRPLEHDVLLSTTTYGAYWFTLPVVATNVGNRYNVRSGTRLRSKTNFPFHVKRISAADDFIGGTNEETNKEVLDRLVKTMSALLNEHGGEK